MADPEDRDKTNSIDAYYVTMTTTTHPPTHPPPPPPPPLLQAQTAPTQTCQKKKESSLFLIFVFGAPGKLSPGESMSNPAAQHVAG